MCAERNGIACIGCWIVDHIRIVDRWPREETLANIVDQTTGTGGLAYNVLVDLAQFELGIPLEGIGFVGKDVDGSGILEDCDRLEIDRTHLTAVDAEPTSYTEVMSVQSTGKRTFFHSKGANNLLTYETIPFDSIKARIVHLGYLMILDGIDAPDPEYGTVAAKILCKLQSLGIKTSVDTTSEDSDRFSRIVPPALKYTDYVILNEIEAGRTTGHQIVRDGSVDAPALRECAARLLDMGSSELAVIHMESGAYALTREGQEIFQPSLQLPDDYIMGAAGAGDAFCAGVLAGIHGDWSVERSLQFGTAAAAASLSNPTCTGGIVPANTIWEIFASFPQRPSPI